MAVTEITKILFRRGRSKDRVDLQQYGGLANGEPGFTSSEGWSADIATTPPSQFDQRSTLLQNKDVISYSSEYGGGDFFVGGSEGADVYIGGSSGEKHWQNYFVSLRGTGYNTNFENDETFTEATNSGFVDGRFVVGRSGGPTGREPLSDAWDVKFYGYNTNNSANLENGGNNNRRLFWWRPQYEALELWSNTALKIPAGTTSQRPGVWSTNTGTSNSGGVNDGTTYTVRPGHIRFNTDTNYGFEGYDGTEWISLQGSVDRLNHTYVTVLQDQPTWGSSSSVRGTTGQIKFVVGNSTTGGQLAGWFTGNKELHVTSDIIAYSSSDERQKTNIKPIEDPVKKLSTIQGVTFDWNDNAPGWVDDLNGQGDVGLIAQQVEKIVPQAVVTRDDGYKAVDYKRVIPLLVEAVNNLVERVEQLENNK